MWTKAWYNTQVNTMKSSSVGLILPDNSHLNSTAVCYHSCVVSLLKLEIIFSEWEERNKRKLNPSEEQTCSIKWRAENVKLVSDAAFPGKIPEWSLWKHRRSLLMCRLTRVSRWSSKLYACMNNIILFNHNPILNKHFHLIWLFKLLIRKKLIIYFTFSIEQMETFTDPLPHWLNLVKSFKFNGPGTGT